MKDSLLKAIITADLIFLIYLIGDLLLTGIVTVIHESGHVLACRLFSKAVESVDIGTGSSLFKVGLFNIHFNLEGGGATTPVHMISGPWYVVTLIIGAGVLIVSLVCLLMALLSFLYKGHQRTFIQWLALLVMIGNMKNLNPAIHSDGNLLCSMVNPGLYQLMMALYVFGTILFFLWFAIWTIRLLPYVYKAFKAWLFKEPVLASAAN